MAKERTGYTYQDSKGRWYARITFTNEQGVRRDIKRSAKDEKAAIKALKTLVRELEDNGERSLENANMNFAELAEHYIKNYLHEAVYVGEMKVSGVRGRLEALCEVKPLQEYFGKRKIRAITYGDIRSYKQTRLQTPTHIDIKRYERELQTNPKAQLRSTRTVASVNKELGKLKRIFNIAVREQWLNRNPFNNGESLISVETHRLRILSRSEETKLFAAIDAEPKRAHLKGICLLALDCALRRGEIFTLKWSDVDLDQKIVTVRAFNSKTARSRKVAMTIRVYQELEKLWQASSRKTDDLVFGKLTTIKKGFGKALTAAQIDDFHFHDCRATCITRMIQAGLPPAEVMRISGHSTLSAFYIYVRTNMDSVYRAAAVLDSFNAEQETTLTITEMVN
ncbi:MAG TPA: tyrosine-type recombinase/integrase [Pyrinomonadaceae bacterium]|jgi:integrase